MEVTPMCSTAWRQSAKPYGPGAPHMYPALNLDLRGRAKRRNRTLLTHQDSPGRQEEGIRGVK